MTDVSIFSCDWVDNKLKRGEVEGKPDSLVFPVKNIIYIYIYIKYISEVVILCRFCWLSSVNFDTPKNMFAI